MKIILETLCGCTKNIKATNPDRYIFIPIVYAPIYATSNNPLEVTPIKQRKFEFHRHELDGWGGVEAKVYKEVFEGDITVENNTMDDKIVKEEVEIFIESLKNASSRK